MSPAVSTGIDLRSERIQQTRALLAQVNRLLVGSQYLFPYLRSVFTRYVGDLRYTLREEKNAYDPSKLRQGSSEFTYVVVIDSSTRQHIIIRLDEMDNCTIHINECLAFSTEALEKDDVDLLIALEDPIELLRICNNDLGNLTTKDMFEERHPVDALHLFVIEHSKT